MLRGWGRRCVDQSGVSRSTEEVYGCEWVAGQGDLLCTASGDGLFLWDAEAGCLLQQCEPPHVAADPLSGAPAPQHPSKEGKLQHYVEPVSAVITVMLS